MSPEEYAACANREDAAAYALAESDVRFPDIRAIHALAAADAHDAANGIHRVSLDNAGRIMGLALADATVERAAQVVHNFLNQNYPCGCGPDEMCPGNSYEATHIARAVLAAAVKEER